MRRTEELIQPYLTDGERLLVCAEPERVGWFEPSDWILIPATALIGWFLLTLSFAPFAGGFDRGIGFLSLFGLILVLAAVYLLALRFWFRFVRKRREAYAVTDRRILLLHLLREPRVESLDRAGLKPYVMGRDILLGPICFWGDLYYAAGLDLFFHAPVAKTPAMYGASRSEALRKELRLL